MGLEVIDKPSLKERTSLRLGGNAIALVTLGVETDLELLPDFLEEYGGKPFVIGRGSNILAEDGDLPLVLLTLSSQQPPRILHDEEEYAIIAVPAPLPLPLLLHFASEQALVGLEGLMGIPGTVGGAVAMNAGSFGSEIGSFIEDITLFTPEHGLFKKAADEINCSYRNFAFSGQALTPYFIIWEVTLKLYRSDKQAILERMKEFMHKKQDTQPIADASAGCIFKNLNPETPAGALLEKCGFKGKRLGGMCFSPIHANFMINQGNGTSAEALELIDLAKAAVKTNFGHTLDLEVKVIP